jgi:hypothetical protein
MRYGSKEYSYAAPFARALVKNVEFRRWVLCRTEFAEMADARLLQHEMAAWRKNDTAEWWRFHFTEKCGATAVVEKKLTFLPSLSTLRTPGLLCTLK